ncbi:MAG: twin-arginine translocase subunit TatC [Gammaproteobacteria bacterium]|nr:twin-arginine translocase subunit TatC [Gammaproteobacteria bacterium]
MNASEMPLVAHLVELRDRLIRSLIGLTVIFLCLVPFANELYEIMASPLMAHLPKNASMIATEVASPFFAPFKLTLFVALFVAMPWLLFQAWSFIAPGLYGHEKKIMLPLLLSSSFLFYLGAAFAYFVVFPIMFGFFTSVAPEGVEVMTDISSYLNFILKIFFAFGLAFEVPIATFVFVWMGITTVDSLKEKRPYIIVAAFVLGMLLTPPDAISQTLLAVPMILLFELGLLFARMFVKRREQAQEEATEEVETAAPSNEYDEDDHDFLDKELARAEAEERELRNKNKDEDNDKT